VKRSFQATGATKRELGHEEMKALDDRDEHGLGSFARDPVVAVFAAGRAAEDGLVERHLKLAAGTAREDYGALAGADFASLLNETVADAAYLPPLGRRDNSRPHPN